MKNVLLNILALFFCFITINAVAQPGSSIELTKPKPYENRTLPSEKTGNKKFTAIRHIYQDMVTHYNYYFNANNEINMIINNAKASFRDDYTQPLIPFYNYSLDVTATDKTDIDSIIYRCAEGVLLHDLRNDWVDDMYYLLGRAYFLRKNFDSSNHCFQYINYAFAPKDEGYDIPIGSNASNNDGVFSIATKENPSLLKKITSKPPARNDAILALCRNFIETNNYNQAASLLEIIRNDPNFPPRLLPSLHETLAYWFYKQNIYDSAAFYLSKSLSTAENKFEVSRWEFLVGQMYQLANDTTKAIAFYNKSINETTDPLMEVYASLDIIKLSGGNNGNLEQQKLEKLLSLAKKDKYIQYRDIIYYAAAQVELDMKQQSAAIKLLNKSIVAAAQDPKQKSISFLLLADINYDNKAYIPAHNFYDSVVVSQITNADDKARAQLRQSALKIIAANLTTIHLEDSLQAIAAMSEAERNALLTKIAKLQLKQQNAKASNEENVPNVNPAVISSPNNTALFAPSPQASPDANAASSWYFNNAGLKSSGYSSFRQTWGDRPNVDNWNLSSDLAKLPADKKNTIQAATDSSAMQKTISATDTKKSAFQLLLNTIPLTPAKMQTSNHNIEHALFSNGETFQNQLENYDAALDSYNEINRRFGKNDFTEKTLFNQYYSYTKEGNKVSADSSLKALAANYPDSKYLKSLNAGGLVSTTSDANPATAEYDHIYDLFISGNFEEAKAEKAKADSVYGKTYWTPQLLFIEAIYYVSKREDSTAINRLHNLASLYPSSPLAERANTMISVLKRRKEIETYLTNLQITRNEDEAGPVVTLDNTKAAPEAKAPPKQDTTVKRTVAVMPTIKKDTSTVVAAPKTFAFNALEPQYVLIVLDSVAPVYANEAGNAFNRYNQINFYNQKIIVSSVKLDPRYNLVLLGPFDNALLATQYVDKTKPKTAGTILPWLKADKFSYSIISQSNMDLLKDNKDIEGYKKLLHQALPQEF